MGVEQRHNVWLDLSIDYFLMPINNKPMKNSFLGILVLSHVISISIVIGSEEESNDNGKFHEEAEFGVDAFEDSDDEKPETKAHYAPSQSYYILNDQQKTPVYQWRKAFLLNMAVNCSEILLKMSWTAVELPMKVAAILRPLGGMSHTAVLTLLGIHSTK